MINHQCRSQYFIIDRNPTTNSFQPSWNRVIKDEDQFVKVNLLIQVMNSGLVKQSSSYKPNLNQILIYVHLVKWNIIAVA